MSALRIQCSALTAPFGALPLHDLRGLRDRFHRLVLDRRHRQAGGVRRRDHVLARGKPRRRHLVGRAPDVHRAAGEPPGIERRLERRLVDQVAARDVDEVRAFLHLVEGLRIHEVFGLGGRHREGHNVVGFLQQLVQRHLLHLLVGIVDQNPHAERSCHTHDFLADRPVADHAERAALELPAHVRVRNAALVVHRRRPGNAAR